MSAPLRRTVRGLQTPCKASARPGLPLPLGLAHGPLQGHRTAVSRGNLGWGNSHPLTASRRVASPELLGWGTIPVAERCKLSTPYRPSRASRIRGGLSMSWHQNPPTHRSRQAMQLLDELPASCRSASDVDHRRARHELRPPVPLLSLPPLPAAACAAPDGSADQAAGRGRANPTPTTSTDSRPHAGHGTGLSR